MKIWKKIKWKIFYVVLFTLIPVIAHGKNNPTQMFEECENFSNYEIAINSCTNLINFTKNLGASEDLENLGFSKEELDVVLSTAHNMRGHAFLFNHQYDKAISDMAESAKIYDGYNRYHFLLIRGLAFFAKNEFQLAATHFRNLFEEFPDSKKTIVFLYISRKRYGADGLNELEHSFEKVGNETGELVPVQLFLGRFSKKFIYQTGINSRLAEKIILLFYLAQYELITGNIDAAKKLFSYIVNEGRGFDCKKTIGGRTCHYEYWGATVELNRLNNENQ